MEYTVVTYGAGEVLTMTFNAIAALINSKTGTLYQPLVRFALIIGLAWTTTMMVYGDRSKFFGKWVIPFYAALTFLFAPTCKVMVYDPVTNHRQVVDHVPWGLGAAAGVISQIGDRMTREIEKTFSLPDDLKYQKTGAVMASNLIANARTFRITNSELRETFKDFTNQCVVYEALMGRKYTFDDLKKSDDIWSLIKANASQARSFTFKAPKKGSTPQIVTCAKGVIMLEPYLKQDVENAFQTFEGKLFGERKSGKPSGQMLKQFLPGAMNYMTKMAKSANEHMMQQMMIHATVDSIEAKSTELGNAPNFAVRRAYLQQRANQETVAGIAAQKLIAMKNVMEALIYAAFIFILPLALLPLGWRYITKWFGLVMWIQMWPPLYAILNFIVNMSARSKGIGVITDPMGSGITIANSVGFMDLHADMAAQAGFMTISVGALAYALVKGGAASFVHLAGHLAGAATSAAGSASDSMMSGNYSFGNVSSGSVSANNSSFGQFNESPTYSSGNFTQNDGVMSRSTSADGGHILSVANSNLRSNLRVSEGMSNAWTEQSSKEARMSEAQMVSAAQSEMDHHRQVIDFSSHQATNASGGNSYMTNTSAGDNQSFARVNNLVDKFAHDRGISHEEAAEVLGRATVSTSGGFGFNVFGSGVSVNASMDGVTTSSDRDADREHWNAAQDFSKQHNFNDALNKASQAIRDHKYSEMSDEGERLHQGISASLEQANQYREESSKSMQKSQAYSKMASQTRQNSAAIDANANQEYVNWLSDQRLPNSSDRMGIKEAETILSSRTDLNHTYQQAFMENKIAEIKNHGLPQSEQDVVSAYNNAHVQNSVSNKKVEDIRQQAMDEGFDDAFKLDSSAKNKTNEKIDNLEHMIYEQNELLEIKGRVQEANVKIKMMD